VITPVEILAACMLHAWWPECRGLLPAQRAVQRWIDGRRIEVLRLVSRGGVTLEKLTHRRHPRNPARRSTPTQPRSPA